MRSFVVVAVHKRVEATLNMQLGFDAGKLKLQQGPGGQKG
jgi:hypothetical protein